MSIIVPPLPFGYSELEPFLSQEAVKTHHQNHHMRYSEKLNQAIKGTRFSNMGLADIVMNSDGTIFKNAAQVWNHNFYWRCLTPRRGGQPKGSLLIAINHYFEDLANFKSEFKHHAINNFGAGWTWLVSLSSGKLKIINTGNAETPLVDINTTPLLAIDVWEHAYYVDYQHQRAQYLENFWRFVDWRFVTRNYSTFQ